MASENLICVEVVYATQQYQHVVRVSLPSGATVGDAVRESGLLENSPEIAVDAPVGVFGEICRSDRVLRDRERVEIYRPLARDPKSARRARAAAQ